LAIGDRCEYSPFTLRILRQITRPPLKGDSFFRRSFSYLAKRKDFNHYAIMFKVTSRDKSLLLTIIQIAMTFGAMLVLISFLGELHGLIVTVIMLIGQTSFLTSRVAALERELRISHKPSDGDPSKIVEKTV
jgi:hypothetical protein